MKGIVYYKPDVSKYPVPHMFDRSNQFTKTHIISTQPRKQTITKAVSK